MKNNTLFEQCVAKAAPEVKAEVSLNMDIANRIHDLLKARNMTQRDLANMLGKRESEISRWLTGSRGFTTATLAKISAALGEPIVEVRHVRPAEYVYVPITVYAGRSEARDDSFDNRETMGNAYLYYSN